VIDPNELGLLQHSPTEANTRSLKTLTRRSIKPKRLFQTDVQTKARETREAEEAVTDIEETADSSGDAEAPSPTYPTINPARSRRSSRKVQLHPADAESYEVSNTPNKKTSPFDTWPRLKSGGSSTVSGSKGRKRAAPDALDDDTIEVDSVESKKVKT
jgi:hypothetical protein